MSLGGSWPQPGEQEQPLMSSLIHTRPVHGSPSEVYNQFSVSQLILA